MSGKCHCQQLLRASGCAQCAQRHKASVPGSFSGSRSFCPSVQDSCGESFCTGSLLHSSEETLRPWASYRAFAPGSSHIREVLCFKLQMPLRYQAVVRSLEHEWDFLPHHEGQVIELSGADMRQVLPSQSPLYLPGDTVQPDGLALLSHAPPNTHCQCKLYWPHSLSLQRSCLHAGCLRCIAIAIGHVRRHLVVHVLLLVVHHELHAPPVQHPESAKRDKLCSAALLLLPQACLGIKQGCCWQARVCTQTAHMLALAAAVAVAST